MDSKLELIDIVSYLPFKLKGQIVNRIGEFKLLGLNSNGDIEVRNTCGDKEYFKIFDFIPILYPLSDYKMFDIILNEMTGYEVDMIDENPDMVNRLPKDVISLMIENHIDTNGLIFKKLAMEK